MNIEELIDLENFKEENFIDYLKSTFNITPNIEETEDISHKYIEKSTRVAEKKVSKFRKVGFFIIKSSTPNIEKIRVGFSEFVANLITKTTYAYSGLMVAIYHPDSKVWRLSYVAIELDDNNELSTNPKRYTFELGDVPAKTALEQLKTLGENSTLQDFKEAFATEKISNKFFQEYKELYYELIALDAVTKEIKGKSNQKLFVKKLLGRIVFLYFLQKKGWLGSKKEWGDGNTKFMKEIFESYKCNDFYADILNPIFFDALNEDRKKEDDYFEPLKCKMPFLNGGLFSPLDFEIDSNKKPLAMLENKIFEKIFNMFNSYNFTIIEDTPHDSEVAIDPEMLGRVFEDLLEDRKDKGAFYTPREIVHYMAKKSIENYLDGTPKDKQLERIKNIKTLDPAIGSGAFPMGVLHELLETRIKLGDKTPLSKMKREIIENNIYGIDIEESAVEIAKLRFWISIVVDEEKPTPLPNLFYKIMVGNSLIETINGFDPLAQDNNSLFDDNIDTIDKMQNNLHLFFNESNQKKKVDIQDDIEDAIDEVLSKKLKEHKDNIKSQLENIINYDTKRHKIVVELNRDMRIIENVMKRPTTELFFYKLYFAEVMDNGGFDLIIGNPPYVGEKGNKNIFKPLKNEFKNRYEKNSDLFYFFFLKSIDLLKENGILSFITTNYFLTADSGVKLRNEFKNRMAIRNIINFNEMKLFRSALGQHNIITILQKTSTIIDTDIVNILRPQEHFNKKLFINSKEIEVFRKNSNELYDGDKNYIRVSRQGNKLETVFAKMTANSKKIEDICFVNTGFNTGADRVTNSNLKQSYEKIPSNIKLKNGIFILKEDEYKVMKPEKQLIYRCYKSSDIEKYSSNKWQNLYVIWINKDTEIEKYPNIKKHLEKYRKFLELKREYKTGQLPWYSQHWAREYDVFGNKDKIILPYRAKSNIFSYSNDEYFGSKDILYIRQKDKNFNIKYILALLNSKLYYIWLYYKGKRKGETLELYVTPINQIPIKNISQQEQKSFEILVDKIIKLKEQNKETKKLEDEIDNMVYKLYGLSDEEILIVERSV